MSNSLKYASFWLVWNPNGSNPTFKHRTKESAVNEAERLAREHRGQTFVVLESVCARIATDILCIDLSDKSDLPF